MWCVVLLALLLQAEAARQFDVFLKAQPPKARLNLDSFKTCVGGLSGCGVIEWVGGGGVMWVCRIEYIPAYPTFF